jgi:hypothetical protein
MRTARLQDSATCWPALAAVGNQFVTVVVMNAKKAAMRHRTEAVRPLAAPTRGSRR